MHISCIEHFVIGLKLVDLIGLVILDFAIFRDSPHSSLRPDFTILYR